MASRQPKDRIIVALDVDNVDTARSYAQELAPHVGPFKVGLELISAGLAPAIIQSIQDAGGKVFYDGKFCDIPNTVAAAAREATKRGVAMFNVHCLSGFHALEAAAKAAKETAGGGPKPLVLGVTLLTSLTMDDLSRMSLEAIFPPATGMTPVETVVSAMAQEAKRAGLDGVIASPKEIEVIREACGSDFLIVTPGVRPAGTAIGDQKRVMTPGEAISAGADYLVIGRPILKPENGTRVEAAQRIADEIASAI